MPKHKDNRKLVPTVQRRRLRPYKDKRRRESRLAACYETVSDPIFPGGERHTGLTRAIKKPEDELGGELFRRVRSRMHLTELGRTMRPFLQQSLDNAMAAKAQAESYGRGETASLRLGCGY